MKPPPLHRTVVSIIATALAFLTVSAAPPATTTQPAKPPTTQSAAPDEYQMMAANKESAEKLLQDKRVYEGMPLHELIQVCTPCQITFVSRYAFVEFAPVPNLSGLSLIAVDGKLASAYRWHCEGSTKYFDNLTAKEHEKAQEARTKLRSLK